MLSMSGILAVIFAILLVFAPMKINVQPIIPGTAPTEPETGYIKYDNDGENDKSFESAAEIYSLEGLYHYYAEEPENDRTFEIYSIDGNYYIESESMFEYWGAEVFLISDPEDTANGGTVYDLAVRQFSGFSWAGEYWNEGFECRTIAEKDKVTFYGDGVIFDGMGDTVEIIRDPAAEPIHGMKTDTRTEIPGRQNEIPGSLQGSWRASVVTRDGNDADIFLKLEESGDLCLIQKESGRPVIMYLGYAAVDSDSAGILSMVAERFAYGGMPWEGEAEFYIKDGMLTLTNTDDSYTDMTLKGSNSVQFEKCE